MPRYNGGFIGHDGLDAPDAPTIGTPSAGSTQADIAFTAGAAGTTATTEFVATTNDGIGATGTSSPITITGLTNNTSYTARVYAKNSHGTSAASAASASFTPLAEVISSLFSTHLYTGNSSTQTITNNINLSGKGGLVWIKDRDSSSNSNILYDTERGAYKALISNLTNAESTRSTGLTGFTSSGFTLGSLGAENGSSNDKVSWTFREEPKFFDIVKYTADGVNPKTISHNLGSVPGMIIVKALDNNSNNGAWKVYHRNLNGGTNPTNKVIQLHVSDEETTSGAIDSFTSTPTSTTFSVGTDLNTNGEEYIAYLFAHNDGDGGFGPDSEDIIKCGGYTTDSNEDATINLGFEPQFVMFKRRDASGGGDWSVYDNMRGMHGDFLSQAALLEWNTSDAEDATTNRIAITPTGFKVDNYGANRSYIYMAIRRPGMSTPTTASDVFDVNTHSNNSNSNIFNTGFNPDMNITTRTAAAGNYILSRLTGRDYLQTDITDAKVTSSGTRFWDKGNNLIDLATNWFGQNDVVSWSWKRAKGYFDVVTYKSTTSAQTITHNLGAVPEMMWIKNRDDTKDWQVYHSALGNTKYLQLNEHDAEATASNRWNDTSPTATQFTVGTAQKVNDVTTTRNYIAFLFATVAGVSKLGSYTGNDTGQNIDCGFSNGARFVLIKCSSHNDRSWMVFDSVRGIVAGADPFLILESNSAENYASNGAGSIQNYSSSNLDLIDPYSSGFAVVGGTGMVNENGKSYIFYAIANDPS